MQTSEIFLDLLKYPNAPRVYRRIQKHYHDKGQKHEAEAFAHLLKIRFNTIYDPINDTDSDEEQQQDGGADPGIFEGT